MFFLLSEALLPAGAAIVTTALRDLGPNWVSRRMVPQNILWLIIIFSKKDIRNLGYIPFQTHPHITNIMDTSWYCTTRILRALSSRLATHNDWFATVDGVVVFDEALLYLDPFWIEKFQSNPEWLTRNQIVLYIYIYIIICNYIYIHNISRCVCVCATMRKDPNFSQAPRSCKNHGLFAVIGAWAFWFMVLGTKVLGIQVAGSGV